MNIFAVVRPWELGTGLSVLSGLYPSSGYSLLLVSTLAPPPAPADQVTVLDVLGLQRDLHTYGVVYAYEYWDRSLWWVDGDAVVGLVDQPGMALPRFYAVEPPGSQATRDLVERVMASDALPHSLSVNMPPQMAEQLTLHGWTSPHLRDVYKMTAPLDASVFAGIEIADHPVEDGLGVLGVDDHRQVTELIASEPTAGAFWHPTLLATRAYVGRFVGGELAAMAGVHVLCNDLGTAGIGNVVTHPNHRRAGHARAVVTACMANLARIGIHTVGLDVRVGNDSAYALYASLGFVQVGHHQSGSLHRYTTALG